MNSRQRRLRAKRKAEAATIETTQDCQHMNGSEHESPQTSELSRSVDGGNATDAEVIEIARSYLRTIAVGGNLVGDAQRRSDCQSVIRAAHKGWNIPNSSLPKIIADLLATIDSEHESRRETATLAIRCLIDHGHLNQPSNGPSKTAEAELLRGVVKSDYSTIRKAVAERWDLSEKTRHTIGRIINAKLIVESSVEKIAAVFELVIAMGELPEWKKVMSTRFPVSHQ